MEEEFSDSTAALRTATKMIDNYEDDVRVKFCHGEQSSIIKYIYNHVYMFILYFCHYFLALLSEKKDDYPTAMNGYLHCLNQCSAATENQAAIDGSSGADITFFKELRGEVMLRIAILKKEMGAIDQSLTICNNLVVDTSFTVNMRANALCMKGVLHEVRGEYPASEVVFRSVLQLIPGHSMALERLGRVYLRYRETIPAAVQCFFKSVETNPSNHTSWYLLGRCYMATNQYMDACEAYNRAVNLNPNDPQVWCSLGVLYYAFGQYREALGMLSRALRLDPKMADAWYNVGALYDMCDQPEDAQQAYLKAKENGLADRFTKVGMGLNPIATHTVQYLQHNSGQNPYTDNVMNANINLSGGGHDMNGPNVAPTAPTTMHGLSEMQQLHDVMRPPQGMYSQQQQQQQQQHHNHLPQVRQQHQGSQMDHAQQQQQYHQNSSQQQLGLKHQHQQPSSQLKVHHQQQQQQQHQHLQREDDTQYPMEQPSQQTLHIYNHNFFDNNNSVYAQGSLHNNNTMMNSNMQDSNHLHQQYHIHHQQQQEQQLAESSSQLLMHLLPQHEELFFDNALDPDGLENDIVDTDH